MPQTRSILPKNSLKSAAVGFLVLVFGKIEKYHQRTENR
jgi:hypothetical protein